MTPEEKVFEFLGKNDIDYSVFEVEGEKFPPADSFWEDRDILRCKNLFFRDNHGKNHFLVIFNYYKQIDIKGLQEITGRGSMTMASGWRLEKYLGLKPGFISVFGLLNDEERHVKVILDEDLDQEKELSFLPNSKGKSFISLDFQSLKKFLEKHGNHYEIAIL